MKFYTLITIISCSSALSISQNAKSASASFMDQQSITEVGQLFQFNFSDLEKSNGTGGKLYFELDGDYDFSSESAKVTFSEVSGDIILGDINGSIEASTNISNEMTLVNSQVVKAVPNNTNRPTHNEYNLSYLFEVTPWFLDTLISEGEFSIFVQNSYGPAYGRGVDPLYFTNKPDFVKVGLEYDIAELTPVNFEQDLSVPLSGLSGVALGLCILITGLWRRKSN